MNHPELTRRLMQARLDELSRRSAARERRPGQLPGEAADPAAPVTLRFAGFDDVPALLRLAAIDSAEPLSEPILIGEVASRPVAALSLRTARVIADPFTPSAAVVELLRARAHQLAHPTGRRRTPRRVSQLWRGLRPAARL